MGDRGSVFSWMAGIVGDRIEAFTLLLTNSLTHFLG